MGLKTRANLLYLMDVRRQYADLKRIIEKTE